MIAAGDAFPVPILYAAASGILPLSWLLARRRLRERKREEESVFRPADATSLVVAAVGLFLVYMVGTGLLHESPASPIAYLALAAAAGAALIAHRLLLRRTLRARGDAASRLGRGLLYLWASLPPVYAVAFLVQKLSVALDLAEPDQVQRTVELLKEGVAGWQGMAIAVVLVAPLVEETIFRVCFHGVLRRAWGPVAGSIGSAAVFGAVHLPTPQAVAGTFVLGLALAYILERTGSLLAVFAAHAAFNALTVATILLFV